jgi:hypothetical protein
MTGQNNTHGIERIVFEPVREGQWRMRLEGSDVEGQGFRVRFRDLTDESADDVEGHGRRPIGHSEGRRPIGFSAEPAGEDTDGEPLFKIELEGEDVEGQSLRVRF